MKKKKMVFGIGVNDAVYVTQKNEEIGCINGKRKRKIVWACPYYRTWTNMLKRCYSDKFQERHPTYKGCTVSDEWLTFSNFRVWMMAQDWEGNQLDKDILFDGNKVYSAENCVFISPIVNTFVLDSGASRGEFLIGVDWHKVSDKFRARCKNPFTKKLEHLGYFTYEIEAHEKWLSRKLELAKELAAIQTDERVAKALIERYTNYIP